MIGITLAWVLVALPYKEYTDRYDSITVPRLPGGSISGLAALDPHDQRRDHFEHVNRLCRRPANGIGKVFSSFLGTSYTAGVLIGTAVILYSHERRRLQGCRLQ